MLAVGASWSIVGIVFEDAPKRGIRTGVLQFFNAVLSIAVGTVIAFTVLSRSDSVPLTLITCGTYALSGMFNFSALQAMGAGMKSGPAGTVWNMTQSAQIIPFLCGILLFGQTLTLPRLLGLLLLCTALIFFAKAGNQTGRGEEKKSGAWLFYALLAFAIMGIQQCLATMPSYFPEAQAVSPILRSLGMAGGTLFAASVNMLIQCGRKTMKMTEFFAGLKNPWLYLYCTVMQGFFLFFAYTFLYPGMDAMANAGAGSLSYPLMVGSCIASFTIYSMIRLKEKVNGMKIAALCLCLAGLTGLCFPNHILVLSVRFWDLVPVIRDLL